MTGCSPSLCLCSSITLVLKSWFQPGGSEDAAVCLQSSSSDRNINPLCPVAPSCSSKPPRDSASYDGATENLFHLLLLFTADGRANTCLHAAVRWKRLNRQSKLLVYSDSYTQQTIPLSSSRDNLISVGRAEKLIQTLKTSYFHVEQLKLPFHMM